MNELQTIEKIHREFEYDLFHELTDERGVAPFVKSILPVSIGFEQFRQMIEHYRIYYPMNNFVTEKQVAEICRKYGLVLGSALNFTGDIPPHNAREAARFKLRQADELYNDERIISRFMRQVGFNPTSKAEFSNQCFGNSPGVHIETMWFAQSPDETNAVLPVGDSCVLVAQNDRREWYDLYLKVRIHDSEWIINFKEVSTWSGEMFARWRHSHTQRGIMSECKVELRLMYDTLLKLNTLNLNHNVQKAVVAPRELFSRHADYLEIQSGYRLRFRDNVPASGTAFVQFINDPILLQPVPGGYLVITKWGDESYLPEFQNSNQN